jgi:hypothetical protein
MSWSDIPGWFAFRATYDEMVATCPKDGVLVEVGVAFGRSAAYLARKVLDAKRTDIRIWAVDPFYDDWWQFPNDYPTTLTRPSWGGEHSQWAREQGGPYSAFIQAMRTHAPEELERLNVVRCRSVDAAKFIGACHGVLIDGNHDFEFVAQDIAVWKPHMMPGGMLAGDDFDQHDFPGVVRAVHDAFGLNFEQRGTTWVKRM